MNPLSTLVRRRFKRGRADSRRIFPTPRRPRAVSSLDDPVSGSPATDRATWRRKAPRLCDDVAVARGSFAIAGHTQPGRYDLDGEMMHPSQTGIPPKTMRG